MTTEYIGSASVNIGVDTADLAKGTSAVKKSVAEINAALQTVAEKSRSVAKVEEDTERAKRLVREASAKAAKKIAAEQEAALDRLYAAQRRADEAENALRAREAAGHAATKAQLAEQRVAQNATVAAQKAVDAARTKSAELTERTEKRITTATENGVRLRQIALDREISRLDRAADAARKRTATSAAAAPDTPALSGARGAAIQNTAFQVSDIFTQITSGTDPLKAIAIQLPQLLGGFGVLGALAAATASIVAPLAMSLFDSGDGAKSAAEGADHFAESLGRLQAASSASDEALAAAQKQIGVYSADVLRARKDAEELALADSRKALSDSIGSGFREQDKALGGIAQLIEWRREYEALKAEIAANDAKLGTSGQMGEAGILRAQGQVQVEEIERLTKKMFEFSEQTGLSEEKLRAFFDAYGSLSSLAKSGDADAAGQVVEIANGLRDQIDAMRDGSGEIPKIWQAVYTQLVQVSNAAADFDGQINAAARNADQIRFDAAIASARQLRGELAAAADQALAVGRSIAAQQRIAQIDSETVGKPLDRAARRAHNETLGALDGVSAPAGASVADIRSIDRTVSSVQIQADANAAAARALAEQEAANAAADAAAAAALRPAKAVGGGGGGGGAKIDRSARDAERRDQQAWNASLRESGALYASTRTDLEKYNDEMARLNELRDKGLLGLSPEQREAAEGMTDPAAREKLIADTGAANTEVYNRAVAELNDELRTTTDIMGDLEAGAREAFKSFVTGSGSAKDAAIGMLDGIADRLLDQAFDGIWGAITGAGGAGGVGGGNIFGSIFGSIFGGLPGFAYGTNDAPGGWALVGEHGPELANLAAGGSVVPATQTRHLLDGARNGGRIALDISLTEDLDARIASGAQEVAVKTTRQGIQEYDRAGAPRRSRQIAANPRKV